jgi:iron complex transport system ATP-binding protein
MTMHDLNQAVRFADRFLFLKNGLVYTYGGSDVVTTEVIEDFMVFR